MPFYQKPKVWSMLPPQLKTAQTLISNVNHQPSTHNWSGLRENCSSSISWLQRPVTQNWGACKVPPFGSNPQSQAIHFQEFYIKCYITHFSNVTALNQYMLGFEFSSYYKFLTKRQNIPFYFTTAEIWHFQRGRRVLFVIPQYHELKPSFGGTRKK